MCSTVYFSVFFYFQTTVLHSKYACPVSSVSSDSGLSTGSILVITYGQSILL